MRSCKIIMYHYVRPIKNSTFPEIRGLELDGFKRQINFLENEYSFLNASQILNSIYDDLHLPKNSLLLTFDDGFKDHFKYVFPLLKEKKIQGLFFPSGKPIEDSTVLDVHKIHFVLSQSKNVKNLLKDLNDLIVENKDAYGLESLDSYKSELKTNERFDNPDVIFVKKLLQVGLPKQIREKFTEYLFEKYVTKDEQLFSKELYMSLDEIKEMQENGMYFGSHAFLHEWLESLNESDLDVELSKSTGFFSKINNDKNTWIMAYPYGNYNSTVIEKLKKAGYRAGLTTEVGDAVLDINNAFVLSRYDTNDFPQ